MKIGEIWDLKKSISKLTEQFNSIKLLEHFDSKIEDIEMDNWKVCDEKDITQTNRFPSEMIFRCYELRRK
jgi:hypothetical protein